MTRQLSQILGAPESSFRINLQKLEQASGLPSHDIRLTSEINRMLRNKIKLLNLDPDDTTAAELYHALNERFRHDDVVFRGTILQHSKAHASSSWVEHLASVVTLISRHQESFALKTTVIKQLLHKYPPKKTARALGYRSQESMLKREPASAILAVANQLEGVTWTRNLKTSYSKLSPSDFETRSASIICPNSNKWAILASNPMLRKEKNNILPVAEMATVVLLPVASCPPGHLLTMAALIFEALNDIHCVSTYLKLCQVKADFGRIVQTVSTSEPVLDTELLDQPVPWRLILRYYGQLPAELRDRIFEPHIQSADLEWSTIEHQLSSIEPRLAFWRQSSNLGLVEKGQSVSLNVIDTGINFCNRLAFGSHIVQYLKRNVLTELLVRYLNHDNVEQAVLGQLKTELEPLPVSV